MVAWVEILYTMVTGTSKSVPTLHYMLFLADDDGKIVMSNKSSYILALKSLMSGSNEKRRYL